MEVFNEVLGFWWLNLYAWLGQRFLSRKRASYICCCRFISQYLRARFSFIVDAVKELRHSFVSNNVWVWSAVCFFFFWQIRSEEKKQRGALPLFAGSNTLWGL